jgi:hypothetical protein
VTLTILAYLGMLVEASFIVVSLVSGDWPALVATLIALAATIATILVTPPSWRRFLPPARPRREHLDGLRQYLELGEADRLRELQSPRGAEPRTTAAAGALGASTAVTRFHLHERLLPYAVLFGLEREWTAKLGLERAALGEAGGGAVGDTMNAVAEIAMALDAAGGTLELTAAVGDLVDAKGTPLDDVDDIDVVEVSSP